MNGSGTTSLSALQLGRDYIGIDMSKKYCELAKDRIKEFEQQPRLFKEESTAYNNV